MGKRVRAKLGARDTILRVEARPCLTTNKWQVKAQHDPSVAMASIYAVSAWCKARESVVTGGSDVTILLAALEGLGSGQRGLGYYGAKGLLVGLLTGCPGE